METSHSNSRGFKSNLVAPTAASRSQKSEMLANAYSVLITHVFSLMILSGIMDIYIGRAVEKAKRYGLYRMRTKKLLNETKMYIDRFRLEQTQLEEKELVHYISDATPAFVGKYRNSGGMMIGIQNKWRLNESDKAKGLYMVYRDKLDHHKKQHSDYLACILMVHLCASMAKLYSQRTIDEISQIFGDGVKVQMPAHTTAGFITHRTTELVDDKIQDVGIEFMQQKTKEAVLAFEDSIFHTKSQPTMVSLLVEAVIDYTEFYIAYVVQLMQDGKFVNVNKCLVRTDLDRLDDKGMLFAACIKDWKRLANELPKFDDIEDLKEAIAEVSFKTPGLDRMRRRVKARKTGDDEEGLIDVL